MFFYGKKYEHNKRNLKTNPARGGISMKIIFLVLFVAMIVMLWVITKQEQKIIELNHEINMRKLGMKGDEVVHVVIFSRKD